MLTAAFGACLCVVVWGRGCVRPQQEIHSTAGSYSVDDILGRCVRSYQGLRTLQARGLLRDYRGESRRVETIRWDFALPDRCRLQIEMRVALISQTRWWKYDPCTGQYRAHRHFTKTPLETPAYLLSKGIPFLLPAIFRSGERALGAGRGRGFADWRLEGVEWHAEHPCYVLSRVDWRRPSDGGWRLWIDQDRFLIRGWAWRVPGANGVERTVMGCSYYELSVDERLAGDCFDLVSPKPILLSLPNGAVVRPGP